MSKFIIGVDIGGTKIAAGITNAAGKIKKKVIIPTLAKDGFDASLGQVFTAIRILLSGGVINKNIKGIGLCAPGPLDPLKGIVHNPPNLPGWRDVDLVSRIKRKFKMNAKLENDANAAAIAEMVWGSAKGHRNIFYTTVSTGIGTGIIIDGRIYHGKNGMAGEGGHMTINYDDTGTVCGCGNTGCVEVLASGTYTENRIKKKLRGSRDIKTLLRAMCGGDIDKITMRTVARAARKKDPFALESIKEEGRVLGVWLGSMISILDPEIIVIGGGVSMMGELILREIRRAAYAHTINIFASKTPIVRAKLKKDVGILGAASLFMA